MTVLYYGFGTDIGHKSEHNEDCYFADPEAGLWLIADGMGGHEAGEVASAIVSETISQAVSENCSLVEAIQKSHSAVISASEHGTGARGMGSTVVALQVNLSDYEIAWVGDSRAYMWDGELNQISQDHSYVQKLLNSGAITREEAITHPNRNIITRSLGADAPQVNVDHVRGQFTRPQKILLCSDGLTDEVRDEEIAFILEQGGDDQTIVNSLISSALMHGGKDNVTVLLVSAPDTMAGTEAEEVESASSIQKMDESLSDDTNKKSFFWFALGVGIIFLIMVLSIYLGD